MKLYFMAIAVYLLVDLMRIHRTPLVRRARSRCSSR
jgi:hypothetical protein